MATTTIHDLAEWRHRLAQALKASFDAMDAHAPVATTSRLERRIRALEQEGRARGFLPAEGAQGSLLGPAVAPPHRP